MKGTFHLNGNNINGSSHLSPHEIKTALAAHEISCHTAALPAALTAKITESKQTLERICGYPIRGISLSHHEADHTLAAHLCKLGICYARTTRSTEEFSLPEDFMHWHPTCHHDSPHLFQLLENFKASKINLALFDLRGNCLELENDNSREVIERFCAAAAEDPDIWYATNIEICDYVTALRALCFSVDRTMVYNPTATDVWISADGRPIRIAAGATLHLNT